MVGVRTFWMEPTDQVAIGLRRYATTPDRSGWDCAAGYHSTLVYVGTRPARWRQRDDSGSRVLAALPRTRRDDPRWPTSCSCEYRYTPDDTWQDWQRLIYRTGTGEQYLIDGARSLGDTIGGPPPAPPGAMWDAFWVHDAWRGPDGMALMVRLPNGRDWHVDSRASNCTRPDDNVHKCWVRHGDPHTGPVTVDKDGDTCSTGAGSILAGDWHGFLRNGELVTA